MDKSAEKKRKDEPIIKKNPEVVIKDGVCQTHPNDTVVVQENIKKTDETKKKKKKYNVMFVCTGNTCRSAMAQYAFMYAIKKRGLENEFTASSSGISAEIGSDMPDNAKKALRTLNIPFKKHKAKQITLTLVKKSNLIVCMTSMHKAALESVGAECKTVAEIVGGSDVLDPYGQSEIAYKKTLEALQYASEDIIDYILNENGKKN